MLERRVTHTSREGHRQQHNQTAFQMRHHVIHPQGIVRHELEHLIAR